ncbi:MAG: hypothetical protein KDE20_24860 [Caldilineaceae bacterium]|nr:hypothetical protein [Caldilineaceae bacterium]MCB0074730.1 hypothetical protein [Caldilineaceae bacterium]MCB9160670.1 hypothetical protein [Caldilineaceae bacterium]
MAISDTATLAESFRRLFPNMDQDEALAQLLLERAQRNLVRYETAARRFGAQYEQEFDQFREMVLSSDVDEKTEQDYFDWELAVTGISDMQDEIARLRMLLSQ